MKTINKVWSDKGWMRGLSFIIYHLSFRHIVPLFFTFLLSNCGNTKSSSANEAAQQPVGPTFVADSAYLFCEQQCQFGPRTMNSAAHDQCEQWIIQKFQQYGLTVTTQKATLKGYDGTQLQSTNIIATYRPEATDRILLCAHWDSRPWADNDPDSSNHHKPVMAANDGASGVAVMLEIARLLRSEELRVKNEEFPTGIPSAEGTAAANSSLFTLHSSLGIDFVCFDAEDWGTPQWAETAGSDGDTWALGAQYWAEQYAQLTSTSTSTSTYRYGILLDMVGGEGARFYQEGVSLYYAPKVVRKVWDAARVAGFASFFPKDEGNNITDDHLPVNQKAKIPCIDIIPYYPDCEASSFGPTWHTVNDNMQHIDHHTLQAVGQTLIQVLFSEQ